MLKEKIIKNTNIPVTIPKFGEKYDIRDIPLLEDRIEISKKLETTNKIVLFGFHKLCFR